MVYCAKSGNKSEDDTIKNLNENSEELESIPNSEQAEDMKLSLVDAHERKLRIGGYLLRT